MDALVKNIALILTVILSLITTPAVIAEESGISYVDGSISFIEIKDVNRQAEAWAMCAAAYDYLAAILSKSEPARSRQLKELSNGAEVAATMSMVIKDLDPAITNERFNSLWSMSKLAGSEMPKTSKTLLAAEAEQSANNDGSKVFLSNLSATIKVCINNLNGQQMYIDSWRELAKSGMLKLPNE